VISVLKNIFIWLAILISLEGMCYSFYPTSIKYCKLSNFGEYRSSGYIHDGIDIATPTNTPIYAVKVGKVVSAIKDNSRKGYGWNIVIDHNDNTVTRYCHFIGFSKKINDSFDDINNGNSLSVAAGELIGYSGNTGSSQGPHLHFGYYINEGGKLYAVDPVTHGLDQPNNGDAYLYDGPMYKAGANIGEYTNGIYFLTKDGAGNFTRRWYGGVPYWTAGETIRIIVEAYDKMNETPNYEAECQMKIFCRLVNDATKNRHLTRKIDCNMF